jgi:hypothetical protein
MNDRGSILPLIAGAVALGVVMVFGVTTATSLVIERQRLYSLADAAATAAAESFRPDQVRSTPSGVIAPLRSGDVRRSVGEYLARAGTGAIGGVVVERAITPDGVVAQVTLSSLWKPPVVSQFFPPALRLAVSATSQPIIQ